MCVASRFRGTIAAIVLFLTIVSTAGAKYGGGSGTAGDPYQIWTAEQMNAIGAQPEDWNKHFQLMADIDLGRFTAGQFNVIGYDRGKDNKAFRGVFDGNGHSITHFTFSSLSRREPTGLFGYVFQGRIQDLRLVDPNVSVTSYGSQRVGALVGHAYGAVIVGCSVEGGDVAGRESAGGLVGRFHGQMSRCSSTTCLSGQTSVGGLLGWSYGTLMECWATGEVRGSGSIGGLIGVSEGTITRCWSHSDVQGESSVGGLAGRSSGVLEACYSDSRVKGEGSMCGGLVGSNSGKVFSCYAQGTVAGIVMAGGLLGRNAGQVFSCYSAAGVTGEVAIGGLVGDYAAGWVQSCYWDVQTSGLTVSAAGIGGSTAQMKTVSTFRGWHSDPHWTLREGLDYPRLAWEDRAAEPIANSNFRCEQGSGTPEDPYQVWTLHEFAGIGYCREDWDKSFVLMTDLDLGELDPNEIVPIGDTITAFSGIFDGTGHTIANFTCRQPNQPYVGLFGILVASTSDPNGAAAIVKDLHLVNAQVHGRTCVGGLAGQNLGTITSCSIEGDVSGISRVGAVVGVNHGEIDACRSAGSVTASSDTAGGIAGENTRLTLGIISRGPSGNLRSCISRSCSSSQVTGLYRVGGLVGAGSGAIRHCYAEGRAEGNSKIGGVIGSCLGGDLEFCYSTARVAGEAATGGLAGSMEYSTEAFCLWDTQASGIDVSAAGKGKTTAEMQRGKTFLDTQWDFAGETANGTEDIWWIDEGKDYPRLWWEPRPPVRLPVIELDAASFDAGIAEGVVLVDFFATCARITLHRLQSWKRLPIASKPGPGGEAGC